MKVLCSLFLSLLISWSFFRKKRKSSHFECLMTLCFWSEGKAISCLVGTSVIDNANSIWWLVKNMMVGTAVCYGQKYDGWYFIILAWVMQLDLFLFYMTLPELIYRFHWMKQSNIVFPFSFFLISFRLYVVLSQSSGCWFHYCCPGCWEGWHGLQPLLLSPVLISFRLSCLRLSISVLGFCYQYSKFWVFETCGNLWCELQASMDGILEWNLLLHYEFIVWSGNDFLNYQQFSNLWCELVMILEWFCELPEIFKSMMWSSNDLRMKRGVIYDMIW
jgi:hypothetical protein